MFCVGLPRRDEQSRVSCAGRRHQILFLFAITFENPYSRPKNEFGDKVSALTGGSSKLKAGDAEPFFQGKAGFFFLTPVSVLGTLPAAEDLLSFWQPSYSGRHSRWRHEDPEKDREATSGWD